MRNILLIILASLLYSCYNPNAKTQEFKQLNDRISRLEEKMDSLTHGPTTKTNGNNMGALFQTDHCSAITKKGTQCKRKAKSNGYCWQHGK